jgi:hypothetical protein
MERFWKIRENFADSFAKAIPFLSSFTVMEREKRDPLDLDQGQRANALG